MNRRDFVRFLALTAGSSLLPEQLKEVERYYEVNTPQGNELIAIDQINLAGMASTATPMSFVLSDANEKKFVGGLNLFGGVFLWQSSITGKIVGKSSSLRCKIGGLSNFQNDDQWLQENLRGHIGYIDQGGLRHVKEIRSCSFSFSQENS